MKTVFKIASVLLLTSVASAGPISSGGEHQVLLSCQDVSKSVQLTVAVVNSDHLEAELLDMSSLNSISRFSAVVSGSAEGYEGQDFKVSLSQSEQAQVATAVISSQDPKTEPRVYQNLICE